MSFLGFWWFFNEKFCPGYRSTFWLFCCTYLPKIWQVPPPPPGDVPSIVGHLTEILHKHLPMTLLRSEYSLLGLDSLFGSEHIFSFRFPPKEPRFENEESIEKENIEIFEVVRKIKYRNF